MRSDIVLVNIVASTIERWYAENLSWHWIIWNATLFTPLMMIGVNSSNLVSLGGGLYRAIRRFYSLIRITRRQGCLRRIVITAFGIPTQKN